MVGEPPRQSTEQSSAAGILLGLDNLFNRIQAQCDGVMKARWFPSPASHTSSWRNRILALAVAKDDLRTGRYFAERLLTVAELQAFSIILLYDQQVDLEDASLLLWKMFNNVDPGRDLFIRGHRVVVDACKKNPGDGHPREWPDELSFE
jgi:4-hydroxy-3-polyprenylbenzoate decarboxylase